MHLWWHTHCYQLHSSPVALDRTAAQAAPGVGLIEVISCRQERRSSAAECPSTYDRSISWRRCVVQAGSQRPKQPPPAADTFAPRHDPGRLPSAAASSHRRLGRPDWRRCQGASEPLPRHRTRPPCEAPTAPAVDALSQHGLTTAGQTFHCARLTNTFTFAATKWHGARMRHHDFCRVVRRLSYLAGLQAVLLAGKGAEHWTNDAATAVTACGAGTTDCSWMSTCPEGAALSA